MISLKRFKHPMFKITVVLICVFLLRMDLPTQTGRGNYKAMFSWAKRDYLEGKFSNAQKQLEVLLTFLSPEKIEREGVETDKASARLAGKVWLLLGAVNEKIGRTKDAGNYYNKARTVSAQLKTLGHQGVEIEELDFGQLPIGKRHFILGKKDIVSSPPRTPVTYGRIEKEAGKTKKKKNRTFIIIAAGVAAIVGLAILLAKKKNKDEMDPNYDTRELGISWVLVLGAPFMMGSESADAESDEKPVHQVHLNSYYISRYEITFRQWQKYMDDTNQSVLPGDQGWGTGGRPVINISYADAQGFCQWLSSKTGKSIRIPTEAQWERAASGSDAASMQPTIYPWGDDAHDCTLANWCCNNRTMPVGSYSAGNSYLGVHDMAGNVAEWCSDWYSETYYSMSEEVEPRGPSPDSDGSAFGYYKVVRGGSYECDGQPGIRISDRGKRYGPSPGVTWTYSDVGLRIVKIPN
jgi:formylglycine-generating enzyme required for sulfatase activity